MDIVHSVSVCVYPGETALPLLGMCQRAAHPPHRGVANRCAHMPRVLKLARAGRIRPELVTTGVLAWDIPSSARPSHR
jgi:hypothetical protein